jgi:hypothetical protein
VNASDSNGKPPPGLVGQVPAAFRWSTAARHRRHWRWYVLWEQEAPPVSALNPVIDPKEDRIGICCSGGGVRSASFNLGVLQELQEHGVLQKAEFLAAVSGGSYIAGAFAMVAKTWPKGAGSKANSSTQVDSDPKLVTSAHPAFYPGSPEEQYLRNRASYLAPSGIGKALLVWRVLLGLLINLTLIAAFVTLFAFLLTLYYRWQDPGLIRPPPNGVHVGATPDGWVWGAGLSLSAIALVLGAISVLLRLRTWHWPDVRRFLEVWSLPLFALGLVIFALELVVPDLIHTLRSGGTGEQVRATNHAVAGTSATVAAILGAILVQIRAEIADPVKAIGEAKSWLGKLGPRLRLVFVYAVTWILGPLLIFGMLVVATMAQVETTRLGVRIGAPVVAAAVLFLFLRFADLNSWSLHPFYRERLCTAFALRRVESPGDPATGHAEARDECKLVPLSETTVVSGDDGKWPTLLVCAAANVSDPGASPPGRGVTSFTFSATEVGGPLVGGVVTKHFEDALSEGRKRDFTLPAAIAMSGAALAPSMGKVTRPSLRFLMCMANVRLGVWVPNPRRMEKFTTTYPGPIESAKRAATRARASLQRQELQEAPPAARAAKSKSMPRPTPRYLVKELFGWNSINDKFLYVSDGGHYENLGLVELMRRGCSRIYCFDASGGEQFAALGDAIALARSELGVEVTFPDEELSAVRQPEGDDGFARQRCATGTIEFTRATSGAVPKDERVHGTLVYAPTVMTTDLPWDVQAFRREDPKFPRDPTRDQLFTDQKFEAYRMLGRYAARKAIEAMPPLPGKDAPEEEAPKPTAVGASSDGA